MGGEIIENKNNGTTGWESLENLDKSELAAERLREKVIDMTEAGEGILASDFESGNYLYHGAKNDKIEQIIMSGYLGNAMAVYGKVGANSGFEGISWSMDGIDALPGTDEHIAGFVAAPELILGNDTKLVIPSRPAPFEMLQISGDVETEKFYEHRMQDEMCSDIGFLGEKNSLRDNLVKIKMWQEEQQKEKMNPFIAEPMMFKFLEKDWADEDLGKLYEINDEEKATKFSKELFQQWNIPVGAVWIKRLIDGGAFDGDSSYHGGSVREVIEKIRDGDEGLFNFVLSTTGGVRKHYDKALDEDLKKVEAVKVPIEKMYFVTKREDLDGWIDKFVASGHEPKGFLLYDGDKVAKTNFATEEIGDHMELANEIGRVVGMKEDFWNDEMGMDVANLPRSGSVGQVIKETAVRRNKVMKMVDGKLTVQDENRLVI